MSIPGAHSFICAIIHSWTYLLSPLYVPGTVLGPGDTGVKKGQGLPLGRLSIFYFKSSRVALSIPSRSQCGGEDREVSGKLSCRG